jgi:endonuclease/exonuclease/phosphatase family metal-dependent hydrolase
MLPLRSSFSLLLVFLVLGASAQEKPMPTERVFGQDHVRFCSFNLKNWLQMDRAFGEKEDLQGKPEKEKVAVVASIVAIQPDILGVCEIGEESDLLELQKRLREQGLDLPYVASAHGGDQVRKLGLLSRLPISATNSKTDLFYNIGGTVLMFQRGILDATIHIEDGFELRVLGVHLKSKRAVPEGDEALMRRNEAQLLRDHISKILTAEPQTKLLAYGDFNEHRNEPCIDVIQGDRQNDALSMHDVLVRDSNGEVWTHFWDAADVYGRLDYFFVSKELRPLANFRKSFIYGGKDFDEASDHRPIVLGIEFPDSKKKP